MRQITKIKEPNSLAKHRQQEHADYDNYEEKDDVRNTTCAEQRGICCYCMGSISPDLKYMKIEHFKCQESFPEEQLKYYNLLGACKGNEGRPVKEQHCDTFKGKKILTFHPCDTQRNVGAMLEYNNDGSINSKNGLLNSELENVLNLNVSKLKAARKGVLDGFKETLRKYNGKPPANSLIKWLNEWEGTSNQNNLRPYCMVVAYWIRKKLN
ncbi:TIGR02646 family protein [Chitinophaga polysaccharea]|uniref:TIGR02646 family protein n=1 Tax=Chitinophaga polysaccharea TaxID=1293035 RepID=UPI0014551E9D|nr:TIGR02646 family protein [Chitinophaga polysaccharea]NLR59384.1 TIGR02646 family protein [Chitinophaga polysaccharea]